MGSGQIPVRLSPLGCEDAVKDGALPAVSHGLQDKHVLDDVEGEAVVREGTQELGLQEGGPFLLQYTLTSLITLKTQYVMEVIFNSPTIYTVFCWQSIHALFSVTQKKKQKTEFGH